MRNRKEGLKDFITSSLIKHYIKRYNKYPEHTTDEWLLTKIEEYDRMELVKKLEAEDVSNRH